MQKHVNLVDLVKSFPTNIFLQNLASIQKRTSPIKFAHLSKESENGSISNLSTKRLAARARVRGVQEPDELLHVLPRRQLRPARRRRLPRGLVEERAEGVVGQRRRAVRREYDGRPRA